MNTADGIELPIEAFLNRFSLVVQHVAKRCHIAKSLCRVSAHIAAVLRSMLDSMASIVVNSDLP